MAFVGAFDLALADSDDVVVGSEGVDTDDEPAKRGAGPPSGEKARLEAFDRECRIDAARRHGAKSLAHGRASKKARRELAKAVSEDKPDLEAVKALEEKVAAHESQKDRQRDVLSRCFSPAKCRRRPEPARPSRDAESEGLVEDELVDESAFAFDDEPSVSAYARSDELDGGFSYSDEESLDDVAPEPEPKPASKPEPDRELETLRLRCSRWVEVRRSVKCPSGDPADATCRIKARILIPCTRDQEAELLRVAREDGLSVSSRVDSRAVSAVVDLEEAHVGQDGTLFGYSPSGALYGVDGLGFARRWRGGASGKKAEGLKSSVRRLEARLEALKASGTADAAKAVAKLEKRLRRLRAAAGAASKTVVDGEAAAAGVAAAAEESERSRRAARAERAARGEPKARKARNPAPERHPPDDMDEGASAAGDEGEETMEYVHSPKLPDSSEAAFDAGPVFDSSGDVSNVDGDVMPGGDFALTADALADYDPEGGDGEGQSGEAYDADGAFGYENLTDPGPIPELDRGVVINDFESTPGGDSRSRQRRGRLSAAKAKAQRQAGANDLARRRGGGKARFGIFGAASESGMGAGLLSSSISTLNQQVQSVTDQAKASVQSASSNPDLARLQLERERLAAQERADIRAAEERSSQAQMNLFSSIFGSASSAAGTIVPSILQTQAQQKAAKDAAKIELAKASQPIIYQVSGQGQSGAGIGPYVPWIVGGIALLGFGGLIVWGIRSGGKGK